MRHSTETKPLEQHSERTRQEEQLGEYEKLVHDLEIRIKKSNRIPFLFGAYLFALLYYVCLSISAPILHVFRRERVTMVHRKLAEQFQYVPEMALHKTIELNAFLQSSYQGHGVDLGCGQGIVGGILIELGDLDHLHGLDLYPHQEETVLKEGYTGFTAGDIQALPFPNGQFDYTISICVLEHIPDLHAALREASRILKPGGAFRFSTPSPLFRTSTLGYRFLDALGFHRRAQEFQRFKDLHAIQYHYLSEAQWFSILQEAGFEAVKTEPIFSRRQLLIYDLLNIQVYWLEFYFADKVFGLCQRFKWLKRYLTWLTELLCASLGNEVVEPAQATHYYISCVKKREGVTSHSY